MTLGDDGTSRRRGRRAGGAVAGLLASVLAVATAATFAFPSATANGTAPRVSLAPHAPTNLLRGDAATFDTSTGPWLNDLNASLQWAAGAGVAGSGALVTRATGTPFAVISGSPAARDATPALPGAVYSGSAQADVPPGSAAQQVSPALVFYDASGNAINAVFGQQSAAGSGTWAPLAPVVALSPAGTAAVALALIDYGAAPGTTVVFDDAWLVRTAATAPPVVGPLHTSGNRIIDATGAPVTLRGLVLNGLEQDPASPQVTQQAVLEAKAWGANFVRVPLGEQFWMTSSCDYSPSYASTVGKVVDWITSLGMVALLDLHDNAVQGCEPGTPNNMADAAQSPAFWQQVASQFAANPLVAFDLYNEPHDISDAVWLGGGTTTDTFAPFQTFLAAGMQQLYDAVRSTGAKNLVFVTGNTWGSTVPATLLHGANIVYAAHAYTCPTAAPPACSAPAPYDPSSLLGHWTDLSSSQPVVVTEFGWPSGYDGTYNANVVSGAESHGWGWSAFAFEDTQNSTNWDLTSAWVADQTAEPSPSGMPVLCGLIAPSAGYSPCTPPTFATASSPTGTATKRFTAIRR